MKEKIEIPIWKKLNLTLDEAIAYSNIGRDTLKNELKKPDCPFLLKKGSHVLIKRKEFEKYFEQVSSI